MMTSYNKVLKETKVSGPYLANGIRKWVERQENESAMSPVSWKLRPLTSDEETLPTEPYIMYGDN